VSYPIVSLTWAEYEQFWKQRTTIVALLNALPSIPAFMPRAFLRTSEQTYFKARSLVVEAFALCVRSMAVFLGRKFNDTAEPAPAREMTLAEALKFFACEIITKLRSAPLGRAKSTAVLFSLCREIATLGLDSQLLTLAQESLLDYADDDFNSFIIEVSLYFEPKAYSISEYQVAENLAELYVDPNPYFGRIDILV